MNNTESKSNSDPSQWKVKAETVGINVYQYSSEWIRDLEAESHWQLYWKQQDVLRHFLAPKDSVMEIGVGTGFTANYLRSKGHQVTTFDIDREKEPDIVGNLVSHTFSDTYDHILAFEVFEHIPYDKFLNVLTKLRKHCKNSLCLSVPIARQEYASLEFKLPKFKKRRMVLVRKRKINWDYHFWEVGYQDNTQQRLLNDLRANGFEPVFVEEKQQRLFVGCERT